MFTNDILDNFFDDTYAIRKMNEMTRQSEVSYDDDGATLKLKVPGFNKKSINISVDSEHLIIEGKTDDDSFIKKFAIDNKYDFDTIDAKVIDGLLFITLPYKAEIKPKKIKVS